MLSTEGVKYNVNNISSLKCDIITYENSIQGRFTLVVEIE